MKTLVVIPTYNEHDNLPVITARVLATTSEVDMLVVDDNSPDGTGGVADALAERDGRVHVLHRSGKEGLGAAYRAGFAWGLERGYEVLIEMDADGSHAPESLPQLLAALGGADVALGSRWVRGGKVVNWPRRREILSRGGNLYARLALGTSLRDITGGFRAYRAVVLEKIDYASVASQGYSFQVEMAWRAVRAGFTCVEIPITFTERVRGESKMSGNIVREALWRVTAWGLTHRGQRLASVTRRALHR